LAGKIMATHALYQSWKGSIDTPETLESRRALLAERIWARMKKSDSQACRESHSPHRMDPDKQSRRAQKKMPQDSMPRKPVSIAHDLSEDD
jgi:nitrate/TMAO reductase-like tetraheme cytochrome c subunit